MEDVVGENNVMPRLCGFVITILLTIVVLLTSWHSGVLYAKDIQFFALGMLFIWGGLLARAKGWRAYSQREIGIDVFFFLFLGLFLANTWHMHTISNVPLCAINAETEGIHRDTLYHNALASSIAAYGYPSLLVNSDAFHNYHFGSHYILGILSNLMNMPTFFVYSYIYPLLFFAVYPSLILAIGRRLRKYLGIDERISLSDIVAVIAFMTYFLLPKNWMNAMADWKPSWVGSESFLVANTICLLFFYILLWMINNRMFQKASMKIVFLCVVVPIFILAMSLCKISVGAIFLVGVIYYLIRTNGCKLWTITLVLWYVLMLLGCHYIPNIFYSPMLSGTTDASYNFKLLYFFLHDVHKWCQIPHLMVFFASAWLFLWWRKKFGMPKSIIEIIKSRKYIIEETLVVICIVGYLPGNIIAIGGGSGFYFAAIQQLYATVLLIGFAIPQKIYMMILKYVHERKGVKRNLLLLFVVFVCCNSLVNGMKYSYSIYKDIVQSSHQYEEAKRNRSYWSTIKGINDLTAGHKQDFYIYVCPSANVWQRFKDHDSSLFFYPAMTGVVCIGELYYADGEWHTNDGVPKKKGYTYRPAKIEEKLSADDALLKAQADGKKAIIYIYDDTYKVKFL
ncbi:hypothetical protein SAMN02910323_2028 [Selenomonas ruminantium]|uniref:Uncharacterized protein n=1 Tax=Selenomonas ruminantium TaxID=971 RepID=A0A1K1PIW9_SELRU|nr:hypothetical protein SAMN02910323_2028 [Selenomonas ruminantium]